MAVFMKEHLLTASSINPYIDYFIYVLLVNQISLENRRG